MFKMGIFCCGHISSRSSERVHYESLFSGSSSIQDDYKQFLLVKLTNAAQNVSYQYYGMFRRIYDT